MLLLWKHLRYKIREVNRKKILNYEPRGYFPNFFFAFIRGEQYAKYNIENINC